MVYLVPIPQDRASRMALELFRRYIFTGCRNNVRNRLATTLFHNKTTIFRTTNWPAEWTECCNLWSLAVVWMQSNLPLSETITATLKVPPAASLVSISSEPTRKPSALDSWLVPTRQTSSPAVNTVIQHGLTTTCPNACVWGQLLRWR
jgi:hypothetical protein